MAYEQRNFSGAMFKNDKRTTENHPNMTGKCMVDGKMYWLSAWTKEGPDGGKYQSLAFKLMDDVKPARATVDIIDDDIGF